MESKARVTTFLNELEHVNWFSKVGNPPAIKLSTDIKIRRLASWQDCHKAVLPDKSDQLLTALSNLEQEEIELAQPGGQWRRAAVREFGEWADNQNAIISRISARAVACEMIPETHRQRYQVKIDSFIGLACNLYQYEEAIKKSWLIDDIARLWMAGHCVCSWDGRFIDDTYLAPGGALVIY